MLPPQSEPATWPGYTRTPSPSAASRSSERKRSSRAFARRDREVGPRGVADEQRVAGEHELAVDDERAVLRPVARACAARGCSAAPTATICAVVERLARVLRLRERVDRDGQTVLERERPWPETWSAWVCVSSTRSIRTFPAPRPRGTARSRTRGRRPPRRLPRGHRPGTRRTRDPRPRTGGRRAARRAEPQFAQSAREVGAATRRARRRGRPRARRSDARSRDGDRGLPERPRAVVRASCSSTTSSPTR